MLKLINLPIEHPQRIEINVQTYYYMVDGDQTYHMIKCYSYEFDLLV